MMLLRRSLLLAVVCATVTANAAEPFVGSPREYALGIGALGVAAVFEQWPPNQSHPFIGGEQKPYVELERVSNLVLGGMHIGAFSTIRFSQNPDRVRFSHGYGMAVALAQLSTSVTKGIVGRKRPNEDAAIARGESSKSRSFFSGHATTTFCLATYSTLYTWHATQAPLYRVTIPFVTYSAATYTAWSRVAEHRHYPSDVLAGAAVGTAVSALVFRWYDGMDREQELTSRVSILPLPHGASLAIFF